MFARTVPTGYDKRGTRPGFPWNPGLLLRSVSVAIVAEGCSRCKIHLGAVEEAADVGADQADRAALDESLFSSGTRSSWRGPCSAPPAVVSLPVGIYFLEKNC
jgi:hypothetical protein